MASVQYGVAVPQWVAYAECGLRHIDPDLFFPDMGEQVDSQVVAACAVCPVRLACLAWAEEHEEGQAERFGVWGGYTGRSRTQLYKGREAEPVYSTRALLDAQRKRREAA